MKKKIADNLLFGILFSLVVILILKNYTPDTFLSGWDTLHPEFNFFLNFQRLIFGVFRDEQGLGAITAHSHMSDLPRVILLYIFNLFLPLSLLRYSYIFLNLLLGPIGMYFLLRKIVLDKKASFLGGLFYLLNLGTLQQFIVPFEMFTTQYAFLPWIFLFAIEYLYSKNKNEKPLFFFALIMLLASPMAYASVLWYVTFISFFLFLLALSVPSLLKKDFLIFKKSVILMLISLLVNSFWIMPNIYFVLTSGSKIASANINTLFSPQAFLYNKEFGNPKDIALIKNFLFDWSAYKEDGHFGSLMSIWINHLNKPYLVLIGFFWAGITFLGLIYAAFKKNKIGIAFIPVLIFVLFFLINDNPPTSFLYRFFQENVPLFKEALRFPADKVLGVFMVIFAVFFAFGQLLVISFLRKLPAFLVKPMLIFQLVLICGLLVYYMLPALNGNLISPLMRIKIPYDYFQMFSYFNRQEDKGRIANLPIHSPWGWEYYNWHKNKPLPAGRQASYQGAGFIWFGIKQPILNRDFDRWNPFNEQYYREMSYAIYSKDKNLLKAVLEKYNINYLLLDENIIAPENDPKILYYNEINSLLEELEKENLIKKDARFGKITIFKTANSLNHAFLVNNYAKIYPASDSYYQDFAYFKYKDYIIEEKTKDSVFYPFRNLINGQSRILENKLKISQNGVEINFKNENSLFSPSFIESESFITSDIFLRRTNNEIEISIYPRLPYKDSLRSVQPLIASFTFKDPSFTLSINKTYNFAIDNLEKDVLFSLGTALLNTKKLNTISIYPYTPDRIKTVDFSLINFSLSSCETKDPNQIFGIEKKLSGLIIFGKNAPICMVVPLKEIFPEIDQFDTDLLFKTSFDFKGSLRSYLCLSDLKTGSCLDYSFKSLSLGSSVANSNSWEIERNDLSNLAVKIFLDATQRENLEKAEYTNILFSLIRPAAQIVIREGLIAQSVEMANHNSEVNFLIPFSGKSEASQEITSLPKNPISCNPLSPLNRNISKKVISTEKNNYIEYEVQEGNACDHFLYPNLLQETAYLLKITSRNREGLPLTICLLNHVSRHCDLYTTLSKSSDFTTDIFLIPPMQKNEKGYDVDIASLGIRGSKSINDLKSIQFIPIPYYFLSNIKSGQNQTASKRNPLKNQAEENSSLYIIKLDDRQLNKNSLLVFAKSYLDGWRAYEIKDKTQKSKLKSMPLLIFPFLFGKELKNHVLVNNWANGWKIDKTSMIGDQITIVIIYLPQYLEYTGIFFSLLTLVYLLFNLTRNLNFAKLSQAKKSAPMNQ